MTERNRISIDDLKLSLHYDPATGVFTRLKAVTSSKPGQHLGWLDHEGYVRLSVLGHIYRAHRLAWFYMTCQWPSKNIDHIDGVKSNNRFVNLRDVTQSVNLQNQRRPKRNKKDALPLGVVRYGKRFAAYAKTNGAIDRVAVCDSAEEAHERYVAYKRFFHEGCAI